MFFCEKWRWRKLSDLINEACTCKTHSSMPCILLKGISHFQWYILFGIPHIEYVAAGCAPCKPVQWHTRQADDWCPSISIFHSIKPRDILWWHCGRDDVTGYRFEICAASAEWWLPSRDESKCVLFCIVYHQRRISAGTPKAGKEAVKVTE